MLYNLNVIFIKIIKENGLVISIPKRRNGKLVLLDDNGSEWWRGQIQSFLNDGYISVYDGVVDDNVHIIKY